MMMRTKVTTAAVAAVLFGFVGFAHAAAPAGSTFFEVERTILDVQKKWFDEPAKPSPHASAWRGYFMDLRSDLVRYVTAQSETDRSSALDRLDLRKRELAAVPWTGAREVADALDAWLAPRAAIALAEKRLVETIDRLPPPADAKIRGYREGWVEYVRGKLVAAQNEYEKAQTVADRLSALKKVDRLLATLRDRNKATTWRPAHELESALESLFLRPNFNVKADAATVAPLLAFDPVKAEIVEFKGQTSYVTPGPKVAFGLLSSDEGIGFFNSQQMVSVTPVRGFQEQMMSDPKGARAGKLYYFSAVNRDDAILTINVLLKPGGLLQIWPTYLHNVQSAIDAAPTQGGGSGRLIASLLGMNRNKIVQKVHDGAMPRIRDEVEAGSLELGTMRTGENAAEQSAKLKKYFLDNETLAIKDVLVDHLALRSRPEYIEAAGRVDWRGAAAGLGAVAPPPKRLDQIAPGVAANVHLSSILTNVVQGLIESKYSDVKDILFVIKPKAAISGAPAVAVTSNAEYSAFVKAVAESKPPGELAIRVRKPSRPPEFASDTQGRLVILVYEFDVSFPAPKKQTAGSSTLLGPAANIYRMTSPLAEFDVELKVEVPKGGKPPVVIAKIADFDPGPKVRIDAIDDDESKGKPLTKLSQSVVVSGFKLALRAKPLDFKLDTLPKEVELIEASSLDPSGWMRFVVKPDLSKIKPPTPR
jgi:hypothetical protein